MAKEKYLGLVKNKKWSKLAKLGAGKDLDTVVEVAEACGTARCEEAYNILVDILARPEPASKIAAVKGLGALKYDPDSQITRLRQLKTDGIDGLDELVKESVNHLRDYIREHK
ncbi:MAG: hypothetical protein GX942_00755 [Papillibacter sp.]|jgi:hypothetical protein|nr:hypothetical protein [Papillibacter sp.]